jgi:hypothetical protein
MMPVEKLPLPSWETAFGLGFLSAVFDNRLKARYTLATVNFALSKYRSAIRAVEPITWSYAQEKCAPVSALAISRSNQNQPAPSTPLTISAFTETNPISSPWIQKPSSNVRVRLGGRRTVLHSSPPILQSYSYSVSPGP